MNHLLRVALAAVWLAIPHAGLAQDNARFPALQAEQLTPEQRAWADSIAAPPRNGKFGNAPYRAYIRSPELAKRLSNLSDYLRWNSSLPARLSEFAILITARQWSQQYEWHAHYPLAIKAGLDVNVINDLAHGRRPSGMKPDEAALYDFATQLYRDKNVTDSAYQAAVAQLGERGVMDVIGIIGYYDLVSMTLITLRAAPPPTTTVPPLPALPK